MAGRNEEEIYLFKADIGQLMSLIIHGIYNTNKDIFLRELISNSSDALNKIFYLSMDNPTELETGNELFIKLIPNKMNETLTIVDTGIGMTRDNLINHLGTFAKSGANSFLRQLRASTDKVHLIGQFGIGFYSVFLIANKVTITTKHNNDNQYIWEYIGENSFTIRSDNSESIKRGTKIVLHLKNDELEYLEPDKLREIVYKYSNFIAFPIILVVQKQHDANRAKRYQAELKRIGYGNRDNQQTVQVKYMNSEVLNNPIWAKEPDQITKEEYSQLYRSFNNEFQNFDFAILKHFYIQGELNFHGIIFMPSHAPSNLFDDINKQNNIKFYARHVFIFDDCNGIIPKYLNFVKGIIDIDNLPVYITREQLQDDVRFKLVIDEVVKCCIKVFNGFQNIETRFISFYSQFKTNFKLGIIEDCKNRENLAEFLRYETTVTGEKHPVSLSKYVGRMKADQKNIYYILCANFEQGKNSVLIEGLKQREIEVIIMTDKIDEYAIKTLKKFHDCPFVSVANDDLKLPPETLENSLDLELNKVKFKVVCHYIKTVLNKKVNDVIVTNRLVESPSCITITENENSINFDNVIKLLNGLNKEIPTQLMANQKYLEINPKHRIIQSIYKFIYFGVIDQDINKMVKLLYSIACISSGYMLENLNDYANRIFRSIEINIDIEEVEEVEEPSIFPTLFSDDIFVDFDDFDLLLED